MRKKESLHLPKRTQLAFTASRMKILKVMVGISTVLIALSFLTSFAHFHLNDFPLRETLHGFFDANSEKSIPTLYSVYAIQLCATILGIIAFIVKYNSLGYFKHWAFLTFVFFYLSLDESLSLHERMANPFANIDTWVVPVLFLVGVLFISYLKFLLHLPKRIRNLTILSGAIYVTGAAGMELVGYKIINNDLYYLLGSSLEEFMEMFGIALFIFALLAYLEKQLLLIKITFK